MTTANGHEGHRGRVGHREHGEVRGHGHHDGVVLRRHHAGRVAEVMLNRPEALNAISTDQAKAITTAMEELAADRTVRAVVISSSLERAFCVGADLKERNVFSDEQLLAQRPVMCRVYESVRDVPVPTVAAVAGYALGGGFELVLSCDLVVADATAVFGLPEVTVGLVPGGGGTQLLARRVGWSRAADLIFTGRRIDAAEAEWLGLLNRLVPEGSATSAALELAGTIAANSPVSVRAAKRAVRAGWGYGLAEGLAAEDASWRIAATSPDRREGIAAFDEKRPPTWSEEVPES